MSIEVHNPCSARKLKIGYIMQVNAVDMSTVSGPQLHVKAVFERLKERGHQMRLVAIQQEKTQWSDDAQNWYPSTFDFSTRPPFRVTEKLVRGVQSRLQLPFWRFFDSVRFSDACVAAYQDFDLLYERDGMMCYGGLIAARRLGVPLVIEVNGDLVEEWRQLGIQMSKAQWATVHLITRQFYKSVSHIVAVGDTIKQRLIQRWGLAADSISVVRNGAEIDLFLNTPIQPDTRSRFGLGPGPIIMFTGSFQPWHGVDLILEGFRTIAAAMPEAQMVFVGDGGLRPELEQKVDAYGLRARTFFTGRVSHQDVVHLLRVADVATIYHRAEAAEIVETPLKLFEYMAASKAIIAPAVLNMQRILTDNVHARLVPPDQPAALAEAVIALLRAPQLRAALGEAARHEAVTKHSWDRAVNELETLFLDISGTHQRKKQR
jgi:glycosyltransferase involved in cell wall biosynthesis